MYSNLERACAALPPLFMAAVNIDGLDNVARGFGDPDDRQRVAAARKELACGMEGVLSDLAYHLGLASVALTGPDPESAVFHLLIGLGGRTRQLGTITRQVNGKLGKIPSPDRVTVGARAWGRRRAERENAEGAAEVRS